MIDKAPTGRRSDACGFVLCGGTDTILSLLGRKHMRGQSVSPQRLEGGFLGERGRIPLLPKVKVHIFFLIINIQLNFI